MKKRNLLLAALLLLVVGVVGTTIAYFTDTDNKTNTFTIGNVDIELTETAWNENNAKNLMPGDTVAKNPTITNKSTTNTAYVFAEVDVPCVGTKEIFTYTVDTTKWYVMQNGACTSGKATKRYAYGTESAMTELAASASTPALFSEVTVVNLTNEEAQAIGTEEQNMVVRAYGIQSKNVGTTPVAVWGNFNN